MLVNNHALWKVSEGAGNNEQWLIVLSFKKTSKFRILDPNT
jgi:hypothetical protein